MKERFSLKRRSLIMLAFSLGGTVLGEGCSHETTHQNVSINGWDITQQGRIMTLDWVNYDDQDTEPAENDPNFRNISHHSERDGSTCFSRDEEGNCEFSLPKYKTVYDYEHLEPVVVRECAQDPEFSEFASPEVSRDQACFDAVGSGQWLVQDDPEHIVRVVLPSDDGSYTCNMVVGTDQYSATAQNRSGWSVRERDHCELSDLTYVGTTATTTL